MSDLISRQAAIDAIDIFVKVDEENCTEYDIGYNDGIDFAISSLAVLPSAQPEQKTGRWLTHSDFPDRLICSECGVQFDMWHWESKQMHFCPNCGAKMEEHNAD